MAFIKRIFKRTSSKESYESVTTTSKPYQRKYTDDVLLKYRTKHFDFNKTEHYEQVKKLVLQMAYTKPLMNCIYRDIIKKGADISNTLIYDFIKFIILRSGKPELASALFACSYMQDYNDKHICNTEEAFKKFRFMLDFGVDVNKDYVFTPLYENYKYPALEKDSDAYNCGLMVKWTVKAKKEKKEKKEKDSETKKELNMINFVLKMRNTLFEEELEHL